MEVPPTPTAVEARGAFEAGKLATIFNRLADAVSLQTPDGRILAANAAFRQMFGHDPGEDVTCCQLLQNAGVPPDCCPLNRTMATGKSVTQECFSPVTNRYLAVRTDPVFDAAGNIVEIIHVASDITERKRLEAQFRQAQKMEAVGRLAGGIAHDFNNILSVVVGYSELVLESVESGDPRARMVREIQQSAERAAGLTRQLLAFSRSQVMQARNINLNDVVSSVQGLLGRLIGEDVELRTTLDAKLQTVRADPGQIEQVLMNLAVNARDAMPSGGSLIIETANVELEGALESGGHVCMEPGRYVLLAVSDTGEGMDPETQARVFEPFFTTKEAGKGTGLGLATVYGIVKQSGGYIWVYSERGCGTTFKIYLPSVEQPAAQLGKGKSVAPPMRGTETVMVVEDDASLRQLVCQTLERHGYHVIEAPDPAVALARAESHEGEIHALLSDMVLPKMSGRQMASRILLLRPRIRVLFMSGYSPEAVLSRSLLQPRDAFLQKPFRASDLTGRLRELLDASQEGE